MSILVNLALIPVVMFYLLRDWNGIVERIDDLLPRRWETKVRQIAREIDDVLAEFLRGQLLVMLVLAVYYALALWAVGLDHAFAIGVLTGLLVFIPYVGFGLGLVLGMIAALLQWSGLPFFLSVLAVYGAGQLLENYVLIPVPRRRSHRPASGRGDLRAARVRPAVRLRRRAARAAALGRVAGRACAICARRTPTRRCIATSRRCVGDPIGTMAEQLTLTLAGAPAATFENFVARTQRRGDRRTRTGRASRPRARRGSSSGARGAPARRIC